MEDFYYAGGLPAVMAQIADLLHLDALTVTGKTLGENLAEAPTEIVDARSSALPSDPLDAGGSLAVLRGLALPRRRGDEDLRRRPTRCSGTRGRRSSSRTSTTSPRASTTPASTSTRTR